MMNPGENQAPPPFHRALRLQRQGGTHHSSMQMWPTANSGQRRRQTIPTEKQPQKPRLGCVSLSMTRLVVSREGVTGEAGVTGFEAGGDCGRGFIGAAGVGCRRTRTMTATSRGRWAGRGE